CARPDACLCPPGFAGKFCQLPAPPPTAGPPRDPPPGGPQPLTRSVYTLPIANYREEQDGVTSMVSVHVRHPPEASVTIHQVERVRDGDGDGDGGDEGARNPPPEPPPRVLAQSSPPLPGEGPGFGPTAGFGYCFRTVRGAECSSPLPGLRTQDVCCRGAGVAWGVHECQPCDADPPNPPAVGQHPCPKGFRRANGSCVDVDECQEGGFCQNGLCTNTRGSFACLCHEGFILDSSRSSCISHQVISEARGPCYRVLREGRCALPTLRNITRQICCCSRVGKAWGPACQRCPPFGSEGFKEICPAGPGYHYSASDLRYNTRYLGQDLPRVPLGRPRVPSPAGTAAPRWRPGRPPPSRSPPVPEVPQRVPEVPPRVPHVPPRVPEVPQRIPEVPPRVPEVSPHVPDVPQRVPEAPQRVPEVPPDVPEVPQRVPEVPPRIPEVPPPAPEVVIVPRPTLGLLGPLPTPPGPEGPAPGRAGALVHGCTRVRTVARMHGCRCARGCTVYSCMRAFYFIFCTCGYALRRCTYTSQHRRARSHVCACGRALVYGCMLAWLHVCSCMCTCAQLHVQAVMCAICIYSVSFVHSYRRAQLHTCVLHVCTPLQACPAACSCSSTCASHACTAKYIVHVCTVCMHDYLHMCARLHACLLTHVCTMPTYTRLHVCMCPVCLFAHMSTVACMLDCTHVHSVHACMFAQVCTAAPARLHTRVLLTCARLQATGSVCERNPRICGPGRCVPRQGGYTCLCHPGFWLSTQGTHCIDVDECRRSPRPCTPGRCENTVGSFRCVCGPGYRPGPGGTDCQDVDECAQSPSPCAQSRCENLPGGYRCVCPAGYQASTPTGQCQDIDECENHLACPGQECANTPGSFQCRPCRDGFELRHGRCADVDECATGSPCGPHGRCSNTEGSFHCQCRRGYRVGAGGAPCADVNECLEGDFCFPHGECLNTEGSYSCLCAQGYASTPEGTACVDVDECQRGDVCRGGRCANTDGAFECHCPAGFRTDAERAQCHDVDECQEHGAELCGAERCENLPGSYRCVPACQHGYRPRDGGGCEDVDECQEHGAELCGAERCENLPGSYRCVPPCQPGYRPRDGGGCEDEDECAEGGSRCGPHAACHNLPGSFQCACHQGYEAARHGHHCQDVDECATLPGVCGAARCENVDGSFLCLCPDGGHEFDPVTGTCGGPLPSDPTPPAPPGAVEAPPGLAACFSPACGVLAPNVSRQQCCCSVGGAWGVRCPPPRPCPTPGTAEHRALCPHGTGQTTGPQGSAADVDECRVFAPQLCRGGVCINAAPGFSCYCPSGYYYEQEHLQCVDNDECQDEDAEPCIGGRCINTVGSYFCSCAPPLVLDGSQRRCVTNDTRAMEEDPAVCWQEVGPDLVCGRPRLDRQATYTECCCLYGEAWGMDCALCPARHSDDFEFLCNVLRPPGPGLGPPYEYGPEYPPYYGLPYGPLPFGGPGPRLPPPGLRADYDPYGLGGGYDPRGDALYAAPPRYEDLEDFEGSRRGPPRSSRPRSPPSAPQDPPPWLFQPHGVAERPGRASEDDPRDEALPPELCGVLSGCEHGRCVRVPQGFTCACDPGYRLDAARVACVDLDECSEAALCRGGALPQHPRLLPLPLPPRLRPGAGTPPLRPRAPPGLSPPLPIPGGGALYLLSVYIGAGGGGDGETLGGTVRRPPPPAVG
ncbi:LOW QUALITY PROTEIN: latent-transforming growth factor beta-binding protein 4, partial [Anas acuta]|uniref:LOW QUALITY PROTEIN: latent-transforming growth factor beta-binding protein 4 n=1 Tax=Anas acuta TaxID=28680 RepID=UPI0035C90BF9